MTIAVILVGHQPLGGLVYSLPDLTVIGLQAGRPCLPKMVSLPLLACARFGRRGPPMRRSCAWAGPTTTSPDTKGGHPKTNLESVAAKVVS